MDGDRLALSIEVDASRSSSVGQGRADSYQHDYWEASAKWYRTNEHPVVRAYVEPRVAKVIDIIGAGREKRLLDVGTGNGVFLLPFESHYDAYGIDTSSHMLAANPLEHKCILGDARHCPAPDHAFDIVFTANTLHHVADPVAMVAEFARLSAQWIVLLEPNRYNPVMLALATVRRDERKVFKFTRAYLKSFLPKSFELVHLETGGMITANRIPSVLLPVLKLLDFRSPFGMFTLLVARRAEPVPRCTAFGDFQTLSRINGPYLEPAAQDI